METNQILLKIAEFSYPIKESINCELGKVTFENGATYIGIIKESKLNKGKLIFAHGDFYDGEWQDNKRHGKGKLILANGEVYDGEWKDNKKHGKGKLILANGDFYDGEWQEGKYNGKGKLILANGDFYDGEWQDDKCNGKGIYRFTNGEVYDGEWKDDKLFGVVVKHNTDGSKVLLYYKDGNEQQIEEFSYPIKENINCELGKVTFENGATCIGIIKESKLNKGKYIFASGGVYDGEWKDGKCNGKGIYSFTNGKVYDGEWKEGKYNGKGKLILANGDFYDGEWQDDKCNGKGKYTFADGTVYDGEWKDNKKHGIVTLTHSNNKIIGSAFFENSEMKDIKNIRYVIIAQGNETCFFRQKEGKLYYQKLDKALNKEEAEKNYSKEEGIEIDKKSYKRLTVILMQLCSLDVAIRNSNHQEVDNNQEFQEYINKTKDESAKEKAIIRNICIPGHVFTTLFEKGKAYIFDNNGLQDPKYNEYFGFIKDNKDCIEYHEIEINNELKFKADGKTTQINFENNYTCCRDKANIFLPILIEIQKKIEKEGSGELIADVFLRYCNANNDKCNMDSEDEGFKGSVNEGESQQNPGLGNITNITACAMQAKLISM